MNLTQQFLIVLVLPLSFVMMAVYSNWKGIHRTRVRRYWVLSLLVAALWTSSLLGEYMGATASSAVPYTWEVIGRHAISLLSLMLLLTTAQYLLFPHVQTRFMVLFSILLWCCALVLDPAIWSPYIDTFTIARRQISHFDFWAAVWVAAWFIPLLAAWLLTRHAYLTAPGAIYRNQLAYWLLVLVLFAMGGGLALIQQPEEPIWQLAGALVQISAAFLGMIHLTHSQLPDLRLVMRRLAGRLAGAALIFSLAFAAFLVIAVLIPAQTAENVYLYLTLSAAGFTLLFMVMNRLVQRYVVRWLLPVTQHGRLDLATRPDIQDRLDQPAALAEIILESVQKILAAESGRIYLLETEKTGRVRVCNLAAVGTSPVEDATFAAESLFLQHLHQDPPGWLSQYDIDSLPAFAPLPPDERAILQAWQHELYVPLFAGRTLAGILGLGAKYSGDPYAEADRVWLSELSGPAGLLLLQAGRFHNLRSTTHEIHAAFGALQRQNHQLSALQQLHHRFISMITPELRQPLIQINSLIRREEKVRASTGSLTEAGMGPEKPLQPPVLYPQIEEQITALRLPLETLLIIASRLQKLQKFVFSAVQIDEIVYQVQRELANMADARRVSLEVDIPAYLPAVMADEARLFEALRNLVHNAVKFNKIGGSVKIGGDVVDDELIIQVKDTGVGIPQERLAFIWEAYQAQSNGRFRSTTPSLGLLFARFIVEAHGGRITVESEYGEGSTFTVCLPLSSDE